VRRREFVALLAGAVLHSQTARAQLVGKRFVVVLVFADTPMAHMAGPEPISLPAHAFMQASRELDWVEGRNIVIERRSAEEVID
jgi:hypothetical protein